MSKAKHNSKRVGGYTLIEILIVLFIVSIVTSVALLSIRHNENKQIETFANELAQILTLAEEQAMLSPMILGFSLNDESFQFESYQTANKQKNVWTPLTDKLLGVHSIPEGLQIEIKMADDQRERSAKDATTAPYPQIVISTNGDVTPFMIYVGKRGEKPRYAIKGEADGHITNHLLS